MVNTALLAVLFTIFSLVGTANSETLLNMSKCHPDNDVCIGKTVTKIIRHRVDFLALKIPKLDPYIPPSSWAIQTRGSFLPVNFDGNWTNISFYGFDKVIFKHIKLPYHKAPKPVQLISKIQGKIFMQKMELYANFESELKLLMWPMDAKGVLNFNMSNVDIYVTIDCDVIQRNGKEYVNIKSVQSQLNIPDLTQNVKYENIGPFISNMANRILKSNWRHLLETINYDLENHIGDIIKSILGPIFDEIPINEFTYEQSVLEEIPVGLMSENLDSSSSSSYISLVQKLTLSFFTWSLLLSSLVF